MHREFRSLTQPLVSRPSYGGSRSETAEAKLPEGDPGGKGISLDKDIPGTSTFNKPEDDIRQPDKAEPGSIYRKDGPDDLAKPQDDPEGDQRNNQDFKPTFNGPGGRPPDDPTKTDYPYRDDRKHKHYASAEMVAGLYLLEGAPELVVRSGSRYAARLGDIEEGLNPKVVQRAKTCSVSLKRADVGNLRWLFAVDCGNGPKVVRVHADRTGNVTKITKMDLHLACSCPAWRWLGSEHHSKREDYLDRKPRGTAAVPQIRDPEGINRVCKHVEAVLGSIKKWDIAKPKTAAMVQEAAELQRQAAEVYARAREAAEKIRMKDED